MFVGEYTHTLDPKGRLAIPYRLRRELEEGAFITRGIDGCLALYTRHEWEKIADKISNLPFSDSKARRFSRFFLAGAAEVEFDKQGRVLLPGYLREFAQLKTEVVIAGVYTRIEIWSKTTWEQQKTELTPEEDLKGLAI
ncbi:division/cell wall cluster transcriptional repressor MraZ [Candidatus Berkelbacteria bacterium]|nr:division/cell wall cluster transcriptional repressor MraZ [Candidatus Berkelbacteria bacterium]